MSKKNGATNPKQTTPQPTTERVPPTPQPPAPAQAKHDTNTPKSRKAKAETTASTPPTTAPVTATGAPSATSDANPKRRRQPTGGAAEPGPSGPADASQPGLAPANSKDDPELVVFAFRLTREERDLIHAAAGSAKASRFVRGLALAAARGDMTAVQQVLVDIQGPAR